MNLQLLPQLKDYERSICNYEKDMLCNMLNTAGLIVMYC